MSDCLCVPRDLANRWTYMVFIDIEASQRPGEGFEIYVGGGEGEKLLNNN